MYGIQFKKIQKKKNLINLQKYFYLQIQKKIPFNLLSLVKN